MNILGKPNQTLFGHIRDCLTVCDEMLIRREPFLQNFCERYGWDWKEVRRCIRFAVWFHDIGKASNQWQQYIRGRGQSVTHALPSFAIGAMSLGIRDFEKSPRFAALFAILAHHLQMLHDGSFPEERNRRLHVDMPADYINEHFAHFRKLEPNITIAEWQKSQLQLGSFCRSLDRIKRMVRKETDLQFKVLYSLILNMLTASDSYASAHEPKDGSPNKPRGTNLSRGQLSLINDTFPLYDNAPLKSLPFLSEDDTPNDMQKEIVASDADRLILNAGCGEGKTAAALLFGQKWLREDHIERIILTLPTKFTANNLYRDLVSSGGYNIPKKLVGITHGDSREFLTQLTKTEEENSEQDDTNENVIAAQIFENNFYAKPVTISTVDHLLMSLYHGYKYADRAFFNVASALVVFDEVHYYEGRTMEAIAEAMRRLTQLKIPHLVMTATIPCAVRKRFDRLNPGHPYPFQQAPAVISGTAKPKAPFEIALLCETPLDEENAISSELLDLVEQNQDKRQIIFVNQVNRAKYVYRALQEQHICDNLICYHSGFISQDRVKKEQIIRSFFKKPINRENDELEVFEEYNFANSEACVLVSTQVSELSLDISADVMYSEIAPIDSIVQRGGRLNRKGVSPEEQGGYTYRLYLMPAYEDEGACLPYEPDILQRSWDAIGDLYTFKDACAWVDAVYQECPKLMHTDLSKAIHTDLVFGKRPRDNYAGETEEEGRVVIRERRYQTYDVVPYKFVGTVKEDYRNFKSHHLSISRREFWEASKNDQLHCRTSTLEFNNQRTGSSTINQIPFTAINADYTFEIGLEIDLAQPTNFH